MALRQAAKVAGVLVAVNASFPPESERPTWEQRDNCIQKAGWDGCITLDKTRSSDEYKACDAVSDQVEQHVGEQSSSKACHEMNMDMDYGVYTDKVKDSYYECVSEAAKIAVKNQYYYEHEFAPVFETCGIVQKAMKSLEVMQQNFPPQDKRYTWEQRDECIRTGTGSSWKACISLDSSRSSDEYKACAKVESQVDQMTADGGGTKACHRMDVELDYGSYQAKLPDAYYQCVEDMSKVAHANQWYYENEFTPLWIACSSLSESASTATLV